MEMQIVMIFYISFENMLKVAGVKDLSSTFAVLSELSYSFTFAVLSELSYSFTFVVLSVIIQLHICCAIISFRKVSTHASVCDI